MDQEDEKKVQRDEADDDNGIFSQTLHAFAEAFTAHGVHYIFERGQNIGSRVFWVLIVLVAFICCGLMLER